MRTNSERAGDRVFADVDQALAERIISRSKKNSREAAAPVFADDAVNPIACDTADTDNVSLYRRKSSIPIIKIAAAVLAAVILAALIFRRKKQ